MQVLYTGEGPDGVATYHRGASGHLTKRGVSALPDGGSPGAFCVSPNRHCLFVASSEGAIHTFLIDQGSGDLMPSGDPAPVTDGPAFLTADRSGRFLLHASYGKHSCAVHAIAPSGQVGPELQHLPTSRNSHCIMTDPTNRFAFVPCIAEAGGAEGNAIHSFTFDVATGALASLGVLTPPPTGPALNRFGSRAELGPRHITFHPYQPVMYVANEQGNSVSAYSMDPCTGAIAHMQTVSTVPADFSGTSHCSEIQVHPCYT